MKVRISKNPDVMRLELMKGGAVRMQDGGKLPPGVKRAVERAQTSKSVVPIPGIRQASEALQGFIGFDPRYSVMDPEAESLASAYRGGESASVISDLVGALSPFAYASAMSKVGQIPGASMAIQRGLKAAPRDDALEAARKNAVKMLGLPENNTAMDRAIAQGYVPAYHGTTGDIRNFDKAFRGSTTGAPSAKRADFAASQPQVAVGYSLLGEGREANAIQRELVAAEKARDWNKVNELTQKLEDVVYDKRNLLTKVSDQRFEAEKRFGNVLNKYGVQQDFYSNRPPLGDYKEESEMLARKAVRQEAYEKALAKIPSAMNQKQLWDKFEKANNGSVLWETVDEYKKIAARIDKKDPELGRLYRASNEGGWESMPEFQKDPKALSELNDAFSKIMAADAEYYALGIPQGANVMPLMVRPEGMNIKDFKGSRYRDESYNELIKEAALQRKPGVVMKQTYDPGQKAYDELTDIYAITDPSRIRSRFAAFDPARMKESDILAGVGALGAGLTAPEVIQQINQKNQDANLQEPEMAAGGSVRISNNLDTMRLELLRKKYA